jgi:hypothetical protein
MLDFVDHMWARSDQTHLTLEHVPQLGQFIQAISPQVLSHAGHARIIFEFVVYSEILSRLGILLQVLVKNLVCVDNHSAEFPHHELLPFLSNSHSFVEHTPLGIDAHQQGNDC